MNDDPFRRAVTLVDAGDAAGLQASLAASPGLACERLETPGAWLREEIGEALDGFFARPYLLWFVSEDPERNHTLPDNIVRMARIIIDAARRCDADLQEMLDTTLRLVCWSGVAARCGVQLDLIDVLLDAGAEAAENANNALVNGHIAAAKHLIERGGTLTLATALCIDRWDALEGLYATADDAQRQFAFVLAALNGRAEALGWMIRAGIDVNAPSEHLYSHGTPLHHAVCSGSIDAVKSLVDAGADLHRPDSAWDGTPLGWALHYVEDAPPERTEAYRAIASYLQQQQQT